MLADSRLTASVRLFEWEAKELLSDHGLPVPAGSLWDHGPLPPSASGYAVKAQTLAGGRGLRGGIKLVDSADDVPEAVAQLRGLRIGDESVESVYVEQRVMASQELYAGLLIDRDTGRPQLMLGGQGGVRVEATPDTVASIRLEPGDEPRAESLHDLIRQAGLPESLAPGLVQFLTTLWSVFDAEDAELVEVNPLSIRSDGSVVAVDARVVLDDAAAWRHQGWPNGGTIGTTFERRCSDLGAVGVEMDGSVAAIVSGAGLMMATVDEIVRLGGSVRAAVDLGGLVLREAEELADLLDAVLVLEPRVILMNAYFQLATCDALARRLAVGLERSGRPHVPIVMRLRGRGYDEAHTLLDRFELTWEPDLAEACRVAIAAAAP